MARIAGRDLPKNKIGVIGLTYIFGIGKSTSKKILSTLNINEYKKIYEWTDEEINNIRKFVLDNVKNEGELRSEYRLSIKRLMDIGCYRGIRHRIGLPLRGQKTQKNSRTRKGKKQPVVKSKKVIK
jgi:small subunit ribosomal protein S13